MPEEEEEEEEEEDDDDDDDEEEEEEDVARLGEKRSTYRVLVGKPEGWRPRGKPSLR
jgi:hypothetical protein